MINLDDKLLSLVIMNIAYYPNVMKNVTVYELKGKMNLCIKTYNS